MAIYQDQYQPYFYIIQDVRNGMYYAGAKWGKDANPSNFMVEGGYETSSETIRELIRQYGLNNFVIRKIRTFETGPEAYRYEKRFLEKVDARKNKRFYNGHNNDGAMDIGKMKIIMMELYGVENPMHSEKIKRKMKDNNLEKYGVDHYSKTEEYKEKYTNTSIEKYGVEHPMQTTEIQEKLISSIRETYGTDYYFQTDDFREKYEYTMLSKYGVVNSFQSEEVKKQIKQTNNKNLGVDYPTQSPIVMNTMKSNNMKKYGVENVSCLEEVKEKKRAKKEARQSRPIVQILRKYQKLYKVRISKCWSIRSDEYLEEVLARIIQEYGPLDS